MISKNVIHIFLEDVCRVKEDAVLSPYCDRNTYFYLKKKTNKKSGTISFLNAIHFPPLQRTALVQPFLLPQTTNDPTKPHKNTRSSNSFKTYKRREKQRRKKSHSNLQQRSLRHSQPSTVLLHNSSLA